MGVPSFFKWLIKRYPKVVCDADEANRGTADLEEGQESRPIAMAPTGPIPPPLCDNPLVDNLYLDMNGIIHPCCHPEEGGVFTEEEMCARVWQYVARVVAMVRPQRTIVMAIDGVAPRAKLNQQRSRRFRSAREASQKREVRMRLAAEWKARGFKLPENFALSNREEWDINVITPGTPFMAKVSSALHYHIEHALQYDPQWRHLTVIFSDATVPGEGEHKIMEWIRAQRSEEGYDPNTSHCLYGMDADLIMLGLATHERYVYIIRESLGDASAAPTGKCGICGEKGHYTDQCQGQKWTRNKNAIAAIGEGAEEKKGNDTIAPPPAAVNAAVPSASGPFTLALPTPSPSPSSSSTLSLSPTPSPAAHAHLIPQTIASGTTFQFVLLPVLREYLEKDLALPPASLARMSFPYSLDSVLDDFILLAMFVGNDFLPHLPSLEIREGALEMMMKMYKEILPEMEGYLSTRGIVSLTRLAKLLRPLGAKETSIFTSRRSKEDFLKRKDRDQRMRVLRVRQENAIRERERNKSGITNVYEEPEKLEALIQDEKRKQEGERVRQQEMLVKLQAPSAPPQQQAAFMSLPFPPPPPAALLPLPLPPPPPAAAPGVAATSGFIHPSRMVGNAAAAAAAAATASASAVQTVGSLSTPVSTPAVTAPVPIPAPKANLSAAALLRQRLKKGESMAPAAVAPAIAATPLTAMDTSMTPAPSSSAVPAAESTSSSTPLTRMVTDPIPCTTTAMSGLATTDGDVKMTQDTSAKAHARVDQVTSMLGKRKDAPAKSSGAAAGKSENDMDTGVSGALSSDKQDHEGLSQTQLSSSPPLELPLKRTKTNDDEQNTPSTAAATVAVAGTTSNGDATAVPDSSPSPSPSPSSSPVSFDPLELEDAFGNPLSTLSFDEYFAGKWDSLNTATGEGKDEDQVQFGVDGWKERYYQVKMNFSLAHAHSDPISSDARTAHRLFKAYLEGLCWVMHYYFRGPPSWSWYYPFHYAPLCEDLAVFLEEGNLKHGVQWEEVGKGEPFQAIAQLMAVLPARSKHCMPEAVQKLMTSDARASPLASFYPDDFEMDLNGKRFMWQAVALLPFIDEHLLLSELSKIDHTFTPEEHQRNSRGFEYVFVNEKLPVGRIIKEKVYGLSGGGGGGGGQGGSTGAGGGVQLDKLRSMSESSILSIPPIPIDPSVSHGFTGTLRPYPHASVPGLPSVHFAPGQREPTKEIEVVSAVYHLVDPKKEHSCALLPGIHPFTRTLQENDFRTLTEKREFRGGGGGGGQRNNNYGGGQRAWGGGGGQGGQEQQQQQRGSVRQSHQQQRQRAHRRAYAAMAHLRPAPTNGNGNPPLYFLAPANAPAHLAGHALNPLFYPQGSPLPANPLPIGGQYPTGRMVQPFSQSYMQQQTMMQGQYPMPPPPPPSQHVHAQYAAHQAPMQQPPMPYGSGYPMPPQHMMGGGQYAPSQQQYPYAMPMAVPMPMAAPYGGYPMPPPPMSMPMGVGAFLQGPPPPGKPPGWLPPPVQAFYPTQQPPRQ